MSPDISPNEVGRIERLPDLERLRGPNPTPKLFTLVEDSVKVYAAEHIKWEGRWLDPEFQMLTSARSLQKWARSINNEVLQAAATTPPHDKSSLEGMVSEMVENGKITNVLDLLSLEKPQSPMQRYVDRILPFDMDVRPWFVIKALFDIDTSGIEAGFYRARIHKVNSQYYRAYADHNKYMLQLIGDAIGGKGHQIEDTTIPEQANQPISAYSIPTGIDGMSVILATLNDPLVASQVHNFHGARHLSIWNIMLRFEPSSLASVRPLTDEEYQKYADTEQRLHEKVERDKTINYSYSDRGGGQRAERPSAQRTYEQQYAQELAAIRRARRNFRGTETEWTNMCPLDGLVPPWIWSDIYNGR